MHPTRRVPQLTVALTLLLSPVPALAGKYLPVQGYTAGAGSDNVGVVAVAPTPDGGYAALVTRDASGDGDVYVLFKISSAGQLVWEADVKSQLTSPNGRVIGRDLAVHSSGRVFITGQVSGGGSASLFVAAYNAAGSFVGARYSWHSNGDGMGWTLAMYGDILYVGGLIGAQGYLARYNAAIFPGAPDWETQSGFTDDPVLGIAAVGGAVFASHRDEQFFSNSAGLLYKYTDNGTSATHVVLFSATGGGRAHVSPDGNVYVASRRANGTTSSNTSNSFIAVVNPSTGAVTMQDAGLPLQGLNAGDGECCAYVGGIVDFGFTADGTMVVAWLGVSGNGATATSGLAGYGRSAVDCGGSGNCVNWQFKWNQTSFSPYFAGGNAEIRSLGIAGSFVAVGANTITCVNDETECSQRYGVVMLDDALAVNTPATGEMQIRRNVLRVDRGDQAVVVLKGNPYGGVTLTVYGPSGNVVAALHGDDCKPAAGEACDIQLDAEGNGAVTFDGKYNDHTPLRSGMYWIVATGGGVTARKPVIVRSK